MNKVQAAEAAKVMSAYAKGAVIQYRSISANDKWTEIHQCPAFDWYLFTYRIKPELKKYRVALLKTGKTVTLDTEDSDHIIAPVFVKWLTDWVEYEV